MTVEGLDFSGKSTLVGRLEELFAGAEPPVRFFREPGGTTLAERVRGLVLGSDLEMDPWAEAYLYAASRADLVRSVVLPRLEAGETVICDRFLDSSLAYQGAGRGLGIEEVRRLNAWATGGLVPDLTFYLRLEERERLRRARESGAAPDRIERIGGEFVRRVERGFEGIAAREPGRVCALDGSLPPEELAKRAFGGIRELRYALTGRN